jgi:hypothetical protein
MLPAALMTFGEPDVAGIGLKAALGLNSATSCRRHEIRTLIAAQLQAALVELGIAPTVWNSETILTPELAIEAGFADSLVPSHARLLGEAKSPAIQQEELNEPTR